MSYAQNIYPVISSFNSIRQNGVSTITAAGDTVWISPSMNYNVANSTDWLLPSGIDSIISGEGRVFSMSIEGSKILAGLGSSPEINGQSVVSGYGYYLSEDGGQNWRFLNFPLDENPPAGCNLTIIPYDGSCDITFIYGGESYFRLRNTVPQQSPPYKVAFRNNTLFSASWGSGLLRSTDNGINFQRIILPPQGQPNLNPESSYNWTSRYAGTTINRYDPRSDLNLLGFSVYIDSKDNVWFGSANGINISSDAIEGTVDSVSWEHHTFDGSNSGLLGDWVIDINEDLNTGKVWLTNWIINASRGEQFGLVSTSDNGQTFSQHLIGQKINSIEFFEGTIIAAGDNGLFKSDDEGISWTKFPPIKSANTFIKPSARYFSVASTTDRLWVGTSDGIASTDDLGNSWQITRVDFPLSGGNVFEPDAKNVTTYAYPNPFSPSIHDLVRIKYELKTNGSVKIRIFDFGMNLVKDISSSNQSSGDYEAVWNGEDAYGRKVANGVYFYTVDMSDRSVNGKILLVE